MALIYPELSNRILGIAMQLHREMGCGFKEKVYTIEQLVKLDKEEKEKLGIIVRELIFSKLALFGFSA